MCVVSYIGDYWRENLPEKHPWTAPLVPTWPSDKFIFPQVSREEFDALKKEMEELKKLLIAGKEFDEKTGQPDCELEEKIKLIKKFAEFVGVDMKDVFK